MASRVQVEIEGRELSLSNLDKVLYPVAGFRKADVIDYYRRIGPLMLAHLAGRPPTLVRAPDGPDGERFFEKRCPPHHPDWVPTEAVVAGGGQQGCVIEEMPALIWLANLAALELHTHQWVLDDPWHPTAVVLDLDPGPRADVLDCARVALRAPRDPRALRPARGREDVGRQGAAPVDAAELGSRRRTRRRSGSRSRSGSCSSHRDPKRVTVDMAKDKRPGRVFVDWSQNDSHKTTVCAYSLRIRERPTVSTPVTWAEIEDALDAGDPTALTFETADVLDRVEAFGDVYADTLTVHQTCRTSSFAPMQLDGKSRDRHRREPRRRRRNRVRTRAAGVPRRVRGTARRTRTPLPIPGTIDDTVHRIDDAGGDAIAVPTNLAHDDAIDAMVATTIETFGRVDMLVNNAAITFPGDLELPMKRFDLVMQVDIRAPLVALKPCFRTCGTAARARSSTSRRSRRSTTSRASWRTGWPRPRWST